MNQASSLKNILGLWQVENKYQKSVEGQENKTRHLSAEEIFRLTLPGSLNDADDQIIEHLAECPKCMEEWKLWLKAGDLASKTEEVPVINLSFGFLEAAADNNQIEAQNLKSACGKFLLGIHPQQGSDGNILVSLEYISGDTSEVEGKHFSIRDKNGLLCLDGIMRSGRLARVNKNFDKIDLSRWSLVEDLK